MKLHLTGKFKSLENIHYDTPDFLVLTGLNGAGKTQILDAIQEGAIGVYDDRGNPMRPIKHFTALSLVPADERTATLDAISQKSDNLWALFQEMMPHYKAHFNENLPSTFSEVIGIAFNNDARIGYFRQIDSIVTNSGKSVDKLELDDFYVHHPIIDYAGEGNLFAQDWSAAFKRYYERMADNEINMLRHMHKNSSLPYLSEEEFVTKYGPKPWELINQIMSAANLDYMVNSPIELSRITPFTASIKNKTTGQRIAFKELSSGEKVLMSLTLALYNSTNNTSFPKVLLLDEADASLHPSMAKQFVEIINNVFVKAKKVKVIITTHSPSTVAFAPEEALFVVNRYGERLEKVSKDQALKVLTSGVPSLSIHFENRRQVFVESPYDVIYYDTLYQKLSKYLLPEVSLNFISSGDSRTDKNGTKVANCTQVVNIVNLLRKGGNKLIWGIIDWDKTNKESESVQVLGGSRRYNIENYILDPLLVGVFLLREKLISEAEIGLVLQENYANLLSWDNSSLQMVIDLVVSRLALHLNLADSSRPVQTLVNRKQIAVPTWYLHYPGHQLEEALLKVFPALGEIKRGSETKLKLAILNKVVDDYPELLSIDILETFKAIQIA